ncbi:SDR family oxidoreductase [Undibacterium sp. Tian12W]|uniref:SDR family oxidoreductase n=1 Tax=Undibacterium sp. Tian12W TaxID=3413054 RepID=UPI003BF35DDD
MIIITGATGNLGNFIVQKLLERIPAERIGVSVRDTNKASALAERGVRVRQGDFSQPETLQHAFAGATQVLLVSSGAQAHGADPLVLHQAAINAAKEAGARRIVYTSHMATSPLSAFEPMHTHVATEQMLKESGVPWTALRNGFYASWAVQQVVNAVQSGVLEAPADGKVSWASHADLAEAAAVILADEGSFDGPTPPLVGNEAMDFADLAAIASALGKPVRRELVSATAMAAVMTARGLPPAVVRIASSFYTASNKGEFASTDTTLERLLGRKPQSMRSLIAAKLQLPQ